MDSTGCVNQRRSYNGELCTIRYAGKVAGTTGEWLGVEWDDPTRGKHSGEHQGVRYFTCKSKHPTAGSFVRPSRAADKPRSFLEALREKYASEFEEEAARRKLGDAASGDSLHKPIAISGKIVEEVGFDKIRKQLAELQELKIVLLDGLRVAGVLAHEGSAEQFQSACKEIEQTCPKIVELDLSRNLLNRWRDVASICDSLKRLKTLKLNGNRMDPPVGEGLRFERITELQLDDTLLSWDEISALTYQFSSLTTLIASANQISYISSPLSSTITTLTLEDNEISSLSSLRQLVSLDSLSCLSLRGNRINKIYESSPDEASPLRFSKNLQSVDLSRNRIDNWLFVNQLSLVFPGLQTLRISGNPLHDQSVGPSKVTGLPEKTMTIDEAYMLTLSRIASLKMLNYGTITEKDRSNAELYYLSLIGKELSAFPESAAREILPKHPRYSELCEIYGEPVIRRATALTGSGVAVNPRSVAARLLRIAFCLRRELPNPGNSVMNQDNALKEEVKVKEIPRSFDTYQVKAIVSRLFDLAPYEFRLIWETDELDPVSKQNIDDEDGWDSEDESINPSEPRNSSAFVKREVELVDGTRDIGFLFQSDLTEARIRVEVATQSYVEHRNM
ncbi:tubulin-specific chaperone [Aspergillus flavus]|nr:tubulin-specific chaperone [Aspergillus flavus]